MTALRLAWKLDRPQFLFALAMCLGLAAAALWLTADMRSILARCGTSQATGPCDVIYAFQNTHGTLVVMTQQATALAPFAVGLVLAVPIVTRELEQRTALIAWPLARSRLCWLAWRSLPAFAFALVPLAILGFAADQLAQAYFPHSETGFSEHGSRGVPLVMRGLVVLALSVGLGAVVGRLLPALLVGIGLSVGLSIALGTAVQHWVPSAELSGTEAELFGPGTLRTDLVGYRLPDGTLISNDEAEQIMMDAHEAAIEAGTEPDYEAMPLEVFLGISADRYSEVVVRESAALGAGAIILAGVAAAVVQRRRPE